MTENNLNYIEGPSSYRAVNTHRLDYENQSFNDEEGNKRRLS